MGLNFQSKPNLGWERKQWVWGSLVREQGDPGWFQAPCHLCQEWGRRSFHNYFSILWYQTYLTTLIAQVRITVFDDGLEGKDLPTGFNADVEGELDSLLDITSRYLKNNLFQYFSDWPLWRGPILLVAENKRVQQCEETSGQISCEMSLAILRPKNATILRQKTASSEPPKLLSNCLFCDYMYAASLQCHNERLRRRKRS